MRLLRPGFNDKVELEVPHKHQAQARELFRIERQIARRAPLPQSNCIARRTQALQEASRRPVEEFTTHENV